MRRRLVVTRPCGATTTSADCEIEAAGEAECHGDERQVANATPSGAPSRLLDQRIEFVLIRRLRRRLHPRHRASMASTMLGVKVDRRDPTDLHKQVAAEIRRAIADGEANP